MKHKRTTYLLYRTLGIALCWYGLTATASALPGKGSANWPYACPQSAMNTADVTTLTCHNDTIPSRQTANDSIVQENDRHLHALEAPADTAALYAANDSLAAKSDKVELPKKQFIPNPQRALWLSLVLPGAGQIYNRKYWKLPIIYGGFLGCTYALLWNQQMYMDYSQAYLDIMDDDPNTDSYKDMLPPRYDITGQEERFKNIFKNKKDRFRRYRDLSAFCFVGVYLISVIDAYVDAQLSEFDITPDLSLRLEPAVIPQKGIHSDKNAYGVGCSINF